MMNQNWVASGPPRVLHKYALSRRAVTPDPTRQAATVLGGPSSSAASDDAPRLLAQFSSRDRGLDALSRLAVGDNSVLIEYGVPLPDLDKYDTQKHEWGLGIWDQPQGGYVYGLFAGKSGDIDWSKLPGVTPVAHTHPHEKPPEDHPDEESVDLAVINAALSTTFTTLSQVLNYWVNGVDEVTQAKINEMAFDYMPGRLWSLFPSDGDLAVSFTIESRRSEIVYTPFRVGKDGWLSRDDGPTLYVEFGPVYAILRDDAAKIVGASKGIQYHGDPEQLLSKCVSSYITQSTFKAEGLPDICTGWQSSDPHLKNHGHYEPSPPAGKPTMTRRQVYAFINKNLA